MKLLPRSLAQIKGYWTAYIVLLVALLLTFAAYVAHSRYMTQREQSRFEQALPEMIDLTRAKLGMYLAMMKGVHAFFGASESVSPDELARYFEELKIHDPELNKGMDGMGVIWKVPVSERDAHVAALRQKFPQYSLSSRRTNETVYPIIHFDALGGDAMKAIGWDASENDLRRATIARAEATREPTLSPRTRLFRPDGSPGPVGFLLYLPITEGLFQTNVVGFVFGAFTADKLFPSIFTAPNGMVTREIFDGNNAIAENQIFDEDTQFHGLRKSSPTMSSSQVVEIFGRPWLFHVHTHSAFENSLERKIPAVLLMFGTIGSVLLFGFVYTQIGARETAEQLSLNLSRSEQALLTSNQELAAKVEEKRRNSDALAKSLSLQLATLESTGDGILVVDLTGTIVSHNCRFLEMWNIPESFLAPGREHKSAETVEYARDQLVDPDAFRRRIEELNAAPATECCDLIQLRDGRTFERHSRPQRVGDEVIGRVMSFRDVTAQRRAADHLAAEKDRLAVTLRAISDAVISTDREGKLLLMNPVAEEMCGVSEAAVLGMHFEKVFPIFDLETKAKLSCELDRILNDQPLENRRPALLINAMGKQILVRRRAAPTHDSQGAITGAVYVLHDTSQEAKAEQELLRASKLESIGLLAGGIAHDFNNVLTGIVGNLSLLKEHPGLSPEITERLTLLERSAYKARQLTLQLLTFAKGGSPIKQTASIVEVIRESAEFSLRGSNVKPEFDFPPDLSVVEIDTGQMSQVIQNLVINAKHATPDGGLLRITGCNVSLNGRENLPLAPGRYVKISIQDFGSGIPADHLGKIFDPYFTTKEKGTGLGLATAYSILKRHEGLITVESELGHGSTFHLYLPASNTPTAPPAGDTTIQHRASGTGRILVMDDEPAIRTLLVAILKHFGYESTTVSDGAEAIREYKAARERGQPYHAVIMDLTIPGGMGGKETIRALREIDPAIRAIVSSGYSNDPVLADYQNYGFIARVEKPYRLQELGKTLHRVLQQIGQ